MENEKIIDSNLLKSKMALRGYNIQSLADEMGVSRDTISNVLLGNNLPSYPIINGIFYTLSLTPEEGVAIFFNSNLRKKKVEN